MVDTYARLALLVWAMTFQIVCKPFRKMFVSLSSLQKAGLLLEHERKRLEDTLLMEERPLMVLDWMFQILKRAQRQSNFLGPNDYSKNVETLMAFKKSCTNVLKFTGKNIPMALLQVIHAKYPSTVECIVGQTGSCNHRLRLRISFSHEPSICREESGHHSAVRILPRPSFITGLFIYIYLNFLKYYSHFVYLQYFLYFAWWKFGHIAANPFGEDEDDINILELFVKHVKV